MALVKRAGCALQLEAADQTTIASMIAYDDDQPLDGLSLPDKPISLPQLDGISRRQMAHAYRLIRHKYARGRFPVNLPL